MSKETAGVRQDQSATLSEFERSMRQVATAWTEKGDTNPNPLHREEAVSLLKAEIMGQIKDGRSVQEIYGNKELCAALEKAAAKKDFSVIEDLAGDLAKSVKSQGIDPEKAGLATLAGEWLFGLDAKIAMGKGASLSWPKNDFEERSAIFAGFVSGASQYDSENKRIASPARNFPPANVMRRPSERDLDGTMRWAEELLSVPGMQSMPNTKRAMVLIGMAKAMGAEFSAENRRGAFTGEAFRKATRPLAQAIVRNDVYVVENLAEALAHHTKPAWAGIDGSLGRWTFTTEAKKALTRWSMSECVDILKANGATASLNAMIDTISGLNRPKEERPIIQRNFSLNIRF